VGRQTIVCVLSVMSILFIHAAPVAAQNATPPASRLASPPAEACDAPALPPGTPTPPEATPGGEAGGIEMGTPETAEANTPPPLEPQLVGTPADDAAVDEVRSWVHNYATCVNSGKTEAVFGLLTDQFLLTTFGVTNVYDAIANIEFGPMTIEAASDVQTHEDGHLSVDLIYTGLDGPPTQVTHDRWFLIEDDSYLKLDASENLPIAGADVTVEVSLADCGLSQNTAQAGEMIGFTARNDGEYPAGVDVLKLPEGATLEQVQQDPALDEQTQFVGWTFAEPGGSGHRGLVNLAPGTYTIACWVDAPEGVAPSDGEMVAEFIVQ
jgi:hypothetical protein